MLELVENCALCAQPLGAEFVKFWTGYCHRDCRDQALDYASAADRDDDHSYRLAAGVAEASK